MPFRGRTLVALGVFIAVILTGYPAHSVAERQGFLVAWGWWLLGTVIVALLIAALAYKLLREAYDPND